jgi:hypothetical protein
MNKQITPVQMEFIKKEFSYAQSFYREEVLKHVAALAKVADFEASIVDLHPASLYEKEGSLNCFAKFIKHEEGGHGYAFLIDLLMEYPKDSYSGRSNDSVRSYRDGQVDRARKLISKYFSSHE